MPLQSWTKIDVSQLKIGPNYFFQIRIDGIKVHQKMNEKPVVRENLILWTSDYGLEKRILILTSTLSKWIHESLLV